MIRASYTPGSCEVADRYHRFYFAQQQWNEKLIIAGVTNDVCTVYPALSLVRDGVRIHGLRQFSSLAFFMAYGLGMLRPDVSILDSSRQVVADALAQMEAGDVLVVASCFPYTPSVLVTAEVAARRGIEVIALTDSASSPLAKTAVHSFYVPNHSLFFSNSMCEFILLAYGLLSTVASALGEAAVEALKYREALISELNSSI